MSNAKKWRAAAAAAAAARGSPQADFGLVEGPPLEPLADDERYTLRETLEWCRKQAGVDAYALDVAACAEAHCAERYFTIKDDGLRRAWFGHVWCNPPYSHIEPWVLKAWREVRAGRCESVSMLLPATRTEQPWWQNHVEPYRDGPGQDLRVRFIPGRVKFGMPGNREGVGVGSPPFGCVLLVWKGA